VAALYAWKGADIAIVYLLEEDHAQATRHIVQAEGSQAIIIKADVGSPKMCKQVPQRILELLVKLIFSRTTRRTAQG
jgi:hypothetical protein